MGGGASRAFQLGKTPIVLLSRESIKLLLMSNHNSPEYKAIIQCSPDLTTAVKDDLTLLSGELLAAGLIAENNAASLQIQFIGPAERAAQLVGYVLNRVSLNTDNYHSFVGVLEKRKDVHKDILKTLDKKFRELGESDLIPV